MNTGQNFISTNNVDSKFPICSSLPVFVMVQYSEWLSNPNPNWYCHSYPRPRVGHYGSCTSAWNGYYQWTSTSCWWIVIAIEVFGIATIKIFFCCTFLSDSFWFWGHFWGHLRKNFSWWFTFSEFLPCCCFFLNNSIY